ncbi:hypothetical protein [Legionella taurinensis]|uniref:Uncharacterized protein n=1 Tax=Legionella taurinensis TaxID=70611 RepID=A0A3A5L472_9GAMM|nr:hypothetical protein [Legionella taurinensis]RJT47274.1 hypothetical protein D6J04_06805 [Legionella taurinensis]RJT68550.1 hypothetical protein D6J03_03715 [Legionella taurinensis]STY27449.1 Uncharacterised protein [Legionella taurinensis]
MNSKTTPIKQTRFLPQEESRILKQMIQVVGNGIQCIFYKRYIEGTDEAFKNENNDWYVVTVNAYYDSAVRDWCAIFGSRKEPLHYQNLLKHNSISELLRTIIPTNDSILDGLKNHILSAISMSPKEFVIYHSATKDYRDRYLIHREYHPQHINDNDLTTPLLQPMMDSFIALYLLVVKLIKNFPLKQDNVNMYSVPFIDVNSKDAVETYLNLTKPPIIPE